MNSSHRFTIDRSKIRGRHQGVSLLEILVSITLTMVLLTSIWSLTDLLGRRFESQLQKAEANQVIRSLEQQLSRDLANLMNDSIAVNQPIGPIPASSRPLADAGITAKENSPQILSDRSAATPSTSAYWPPSEGWQQLATSRASITTLQGSSRQLEILVFTDPLDLKINQLLREPAETLPADGVSSSISPLSLIRRIRYRGIPQPAVDSGAEAFDSGSDDGVNFPGERSSAEALAREDSPFDPGESLQTASEFPERLTPKSSVGSGDGPRDEQDPESIQANRSDWERIPEIQDYRFSYFDGFQWRASWNSQLDRGLPQALRLEFNLRKIKSNTRNRTRDRESFATTSSAVDQWTNPLSDRQRSGRRDDEIADSVAFEHSLIFALGPSSNPDSSLDRSGLGEGDRNRVTPDGNSTSLDPF